MKGDIVMLYSVCGIETYSKCIKLHLKSTDPVLNDGKGYKVLTELVPKNHEFESLEIGSIVRSRIINVNGTYRTVIYV